MQELLRNAVNGWLEYTGAGKYAVLLLGILLWYWFRSVCVEKPQKKLMTYATVTAVMVIFPLTAVLLMKYQTKFYDYKWVWSIVPVTLVTAWGMTILYLDYYRKNLKGKVLKPACLLALGLAVILLCGNLNVDGCEGMRAADDKAKTEKILDKLANSGNTEDICLWAPKEVLKHVRELDGEIRLLYGRNMWEAALNAYAYDVYDQETIALYEWMEGFETDQGQAAYSEEEADLTDSDAIAAALQRGVNCILIPEEKADEIPQYMADVAAQINLTVTLEAAEGYYIYRLRS